MIHTFWSLVIGHLVIGQCYEGMKRLVILKTVNLRRFHISQLRFLTSLQIITLRNCVF